MPELNTLVRLLREPAPAAAQADALLALCRARAPLERALYLAMSKVRSRRMTWIPAQAGIVWRRALPILRQAQDEVGARWGLSCLVHIRPTSS